VDAYVGQTLFHVTRALRGVAGAAAGLGIGVSALVVVLVLRLHLVQERRRMGALSAVGFSIREILGQLRGRALIAILAGTAAGLVLAGTGGQAMIGSALGLAGLGITHLDLIPNPWLVDLAVPLALIAAGGLPAIAVTSPLRHADTGDWLTGAS
jgi:putative ABC transport system permease protein